MNSADRNLLILKLLTFSILCADKSFSIRISDPTPREVSDQSLKTAVFALGSFWRSEAVFGCLNGVVRTTSGYAGGSKTNPEYRSLGDHAESVMGLFGQVYTNELSETITSDHRIVKVEYDPKEIHFRQLLEVFWSSHDPRQVFGQGPDVGNQYRSIIFTNGTDEARLATMSKEREQTKSRNSIVTTQIQKLESFYPADPEHQKFELKRHPLLLQLMGNLPQDELEVSNLAAKLNGYAAELCPPNIQKHIDAKINGIIRRGWPVLRNI